MLAKLLFMSVLESNCYVERVETVGLIKAFLDGESKGSLLLLSCGAHPRLSINSDLAAKTGF
jgi:hypothetical protein